jgi:hypothetical protein
MMIANHAKVIASPNSLVTFESSWLSPCRWCRLTHAMKKKYILLYQFSNYIYVFLNQYITKMI